MTAKQKYFDCHFHIIDKNFPLVANQGFMPEAFTSEDYPERDRRRLESMAAGI